MEFCLKFINKWYSGCIPSHDGHFPLYDIFKSVSLHDGTVPSHDGTVTVPVSLSWLDVLTRNSEFYVLQKGKFFSWFLMIGKYKLIYSCARGHSFNFFDESGRWTTPRRFKTKQARSRARAARRTNWNVLVFCMICLSWFFDLLSEREREREIC